MTDVAGWATPVAGWFLTYALHSSVALGGAWLLERSGRVRSAAARDVLWKSALLVGFVTASVRVGLAPSDRSGALEEALRTAAGFDGVERTRVEDLFDDHVLKASSAPATRESSARRVKIEAHLSRPTPACLDALRTPASAAAEGAAALRRVCGVDAWRVRLPVTLSGTWLLGGLLLLVGAGRRRRAVKGLLARRERVTAGGPRTVLDELCVRAGLSGPVELFWIEGLESPAVIGPGAIGLPARAAELDRAELTAALGHELAHLARRDALWLGAARVLAGVAFMQPLNRVALRRLEETAELLADDWTVKRTGDPVGLARVLATVAGWVTRSGPSPVLSMTSWRSPLGRRVERLISGEERTGTPRLTLVLVGAALWFPVAAIPAVSAPTGSVIRIETDPPGGVERVEGPTAGRHEVRVLIRGTGP